MASLKPRAAYTERAESDHCVYREAAQASPLKAQRLPRLQPTPTPHHSEGEAGAQLDRMYDAVVSPSKARADLGEANMLAFADAQKTYEAPAPAPAAPKTPVVAEAPARPRGRASKGMVFHRDVHAKGLTVSYDEDASFLALMRGAAASVAGAAPAQAAAQAPFARRRRSSIPGLDAILRETAASPQKKPPAAASTQRPRGVVRVVDGAARAAVVAAADLLAFQDAGFVAVPAYRAPPVSRAAVTFFSPAESSRAPNAGASW